MSGEPVKLRSRLSFGDTLRVAVTGPRSRKLRSALSTLGITTVSYTHLTLPTKA